MELLLLAFNEEEGESSRINPADEDESIIPVTMAITVYSHIVSNLFVSLFFFLSFACLNENFFQTRSVLM